MEWQLVTVMHTERVVTAQPGVSGSPRVASASLLGGVLQPPIWPEKYYSCCHAGSCLLGTMSIWPALIFVSNSAMEVSVTWGNKS